MLFLLWVSSSSNKARSFYSQLFSRKYAKLSFIIEKMKKLKMKKILKKFSKENKKF
jgi:hypothetical protein